MGLAPPSATAFSTPTATAYSAPTATLTTTPNGKANDDDSLGDEFVGATPGVGLLGATNDAA